MAWQINFTPTAAKEMSNLDNKIQERIRIFLRERVAPGPRTSGSPLKGQLRESWRWRVGDYRILGKIDDDQVLVLVVHVGHRSKVYGRH